MNHNNKLIIFVVLLLLLDSTTAIKIDVDDPELEVDTEDFIPINPKKPIVDRQNKALESEKRYVIMFGNKAGVGKAQKGDVCPFYVAQQRFEGTVGKPLVVSFRIPAGPGTSPGPGGPIYEGTSVAIRFIPSVDSDDACHNDTPMNDWWQVIDEEVNGTMTGFVRTGGSMPWGVFPTSNVLFKIQHYVGEPDNRFTGTPVYKLQYCPLAKPCRDIGVRPDPVTGRPLFQVNPEDYKYPFAIEFQEPKYLKDKL